MKVLKFEGAGWDKAESNGVGNCRIRATFVNDNGTEIYLEMSGIKRPFNCVDRQKNFEFPWHIWHLFKVADRDKHYTKAYKKFDSEIREFTKKNILNFVNENLGCSFESLEVINDGTWSGFSVDGRDSTEAV